jgi:hypothetical protein
MSAPVRNQTDDLLPTPTMYAPPWAREDARAASKQAADSALAASEEFRRVLPPAPLLNEKPRTRWREPAPFDGDLAAVRLRERPSLDPVAVPPPPLHQRSAVTDLLLARIAGAVCLAALAALLMVGTMPLKGAVKAESETALPSLWSRFGATAPARPSVQPASEEPVALSDRFPAPVEVASAPPQAAQPVPVAQPVQVAAVALPMQSAQSAQNEIALRALGSDEIAGLYRRSRELIVQGDIAAARLLLTRAAEAGDARSALALAATYDPAELARLGVLGLAGDAGQARAWYAKAAEFGSGEAARRLEQLAQSR